MTARRKTLVTLLLTILFMMVFIPMAFAAEGTPEAADNYFTFAKWSALAAGLAIAGAAFGGAISQGRAVTAALEGIARNPQASGKIMVPMILGLALIESLVIYAWLTSISLIGNINTDILQQLVDHYIK